MSQNHTALLVDDDIEDQEIFLLIMKEARSRVHFVFANDGIHALEMINDKSFNPDLILIDINMPKMNGIDCLAEIKKIDRMARTPVYMYSTATDPKVIERCLRLGADGFIEKKANTDEAKKEFQSLFAAINF